MNYDNLKNKSISFLDSLKRAAEDDDIIIKDITNQLELRGEGSIYGEGVITITYAQPIGYKEPTKLRTIEKTILNETLKDGFDYIARDKNGDLCVYRAKPYKMEKGWETRGYYFTKQIAPILFTFIKWTDEEPYEIKKLLEEEEK